MEKDISNPTIAIRDGEAFDLDSLGAYLTSQLPGLVGQPTVQQFPGGRSNLTYRLQFENRSLVLRRPPFGTKAKSAHDMRREYTVVRGIGMKSDRVPKVLLHCADENVIGAEFFVMEEVDGFLARREFPAEWGWGKGECQRFCRSFWEVMIEIHALDYSSLDLGDYARPKGYARRQIEGWNRRYERARTPNSPAASRLMKWLEQNIPEDGEATLLHNDYRIDNLILKPDDPVRIAAVLDWEMAAVGNPLMDLGNSLAYWIEAGDDAKAIAGSSQPSFLPGMLSRRDVVDLYAEQTGRDVGRIKVYYIAGLFRLAAIIQQIYYRYHHGQTNDHRFAGWDSEVRRLLERCESILDGASW